MATIGCAPRFVVCLECRALLVSGADYCPACHSRQDVLRRERNICDDGPMPKKRPETPAPELMR